MLHRARLALAIAILSSCTIGGGADSEDSKAGDGLSDEDLDGADDAHGDSAPSRVCAAGEVTKGIDVSYYQGNVNWPAVKASGVEFAFIRVSDGEVFKDPKFDRNWTNAKAAGVIRGAYQFFRPTQSVQEQARMMISAIGPHQSGDLPPVIDVEATGGLSGKQIAAKVGQWLTLVEAGVGVKPIIYTGKYFWRDNVAGAIDYVSSPLWIAQYTNRCPSLPSPWTTWSFWQHSAKGSVPGISGAVDLNKFNGTLAQLQAFANSGAPATSAAFAAMPFFWARDTSGNYTFVGETQDLPTVARVEFRVDDYLIGSAPSANQQAVVNYVFNVKSLARKIEARGVDSDGATIAVGNGLIDSTDLPQAYVNQFAASTYEIGTEEVAAASVEVFANNASLVDVVSGEQQSTRGIVRHQFTAPGIHQLRIVTRDSGGAIVGSVDRSFLVR